MDSHWLQSWFAQKTSGPGKRVAVLKLIISAEVYIEERGWLETGWRIWEELSDQADCRDRDDWNTARGKWQTIEQRAEWAKPCFKSASVRALEVGSISWRLEWDAYGRSTRKEWRCGHGCSRCAWDRLDSLSGPVVWQVSCGADCAGVKARGSSSGETFATLTPSKKMHCCSLNGGIGLPSGGDRSPKGKVGVFHHSGKATETCQVARWCGPFQADGIPGRWWVRVVWWRWQRLGYDRCCRQEEHRPATWWLRGEHRWQGQDQDSAQVWRVLYRQPGVHYQVFESFGSELPKAKAYHRACRVCFLKAVKSADDSGSDSSGSDEEISSSSSDALWRKVEMRGGLGTCPLPLRSSCDVSWVDGSWIVLELAPADSCLLVNRCRLFSLCPQPF